MCNNDNSSLIFLFPNPNYMSKFSFKNFYIGLWGISPTYLYGDPATWNIGYNIRYSKNQNQVEIKTCQYIVLDN